MLALVRQSIFIARRTGWARRWHTGRFVNRFPVVLLVATALGSVSFAAPAAECGGASAPKADIVALKSGETVTLAEVWWIARCHSLLKGPMSVEILDGPPEITAAIVEQDVIPHNSDCANPVKGGLLKLTAAKQLANRMRAEVVLRVKYPTEDGDRQKSFDIDAIVIP